MPSMRSWAFSSANTHVFGPDFANSTPEEWVQRGPDAITSVLVNEAGPLSSGSWMSVEPNTSHIKYLRSYTILPFIFLLAIIRNHHDSFLLKYLLGYITYSCGQAKSSIHFASEIIIKIIQKPSQSPQKGSKKPTASSAGLNSKILFSIVTKFWQNP